MQATCANCGNDYDKAFKVSMQNRDYYFDSFECAINKLAPQCMVCKTRIIGHGVEKNGQFYCCVHCANHKEGTKELRDRVN